MGRKAGTVVGVNSCLVALVATESVSIAISWLLLPPEVGVDRHGHSINPFEFPFQLTGEQLVTPLLKNSSGKIFFIFHSHSWPLPRSACIKPFHTFLGDLHSHKRSRLFKRSFSNCR